MFQSGDRGLIDNKGIVLYITPFVTLWPSDTIWWQRSGLIYIDVFLHYPSFAFYISSLIISLWNIKYFALSHSIDVCNLSKPEPTTSKRWFGS